jgi:hypothetical protein
VGWELPVCRGVKDLGGLVTYRLGSKTIAGLLSSISPSSHLQQQLPAPAFLRRCLNSSQILVYAAHLI